MVLVRTFERVGLSFSLLSVSWLLLLCVGRLGLVLWAFYLLERKIFERASVFFLLQGRLNKMVLQSGRGSVRGEVRGDRARGNLEGL